MRTIASGYFNCDVLDDKPQKRNPPLQHLLLSKTHRKRPKVIIIAAGYSDSQRGRLKTNTEKRKDL